jgi:hypothetical protein
MVGILIHGNNHFILSGPLSDEAAALVLLRHSSIAEELREYLEWAVIVPGDRETSPRSDAITSRTFSWRRIIRRLSSAEIE